MFKYFNKNKNWNYILGQAEISGHFSRYAKDISDEYPITPRSLKGGIEGLMPEYKRSRTGRLEDLNIRINCMHFHNAVVSDNVDKACDIYDKLLEDYEDWLDKQNV